MLNPNCLLLSLIHTPYTPNDHLRMTTTTAGMRVNTLGKDGEGGGGGGVGGGGGGGGDSFLQLQRSASGNPRGHKTSRH
jgi:hypothetical protein